MNHRIKHSLTAAKRPCDEDCTPLAIKDYYARRRYGMERVAVRMVHGTLERYLRSHPDLSIDDKKNIAYKIIHLPYGINAWSEYMPGGFATHYAYMPHRPDMPNGKRLDRVTAAFFRHSYDAVGLRTRAHILGWRVKQYLDNHEGDVNWMSIACGTGQSTYDIVRSFSSQDQARLHLLLTDTDRDVLSFAGSRYRLDHEIEADVMFAVLDATDESRFKATAKQFKPSIIDAMGIFEYLDNAKAIMLLRHAYALLPIGGVMIFTNMTPDHPHLEVHKRGLGWPGVLQRSAADMRQLVARASIQPGELRMYHDQDKVYNVYEVTKK